MTGFQFPKRESFKPASQPRVFAGVVIFMGLAAIPFMFKSVRDRENSVARMRDDSYDNRDANTKAEAKDSARNDRLRTGKPKPE
eukprot:6511582-Pyramimonas_sp.AAC.1